MAIVRESGFVAGKGDIIDGRDQPENMLKQK